MGNSSGASYQPRTGGAFAVPLFRRIDLNQAAPVPNTWYTAATLTNVVMWDIRAQIATVGEDIETRLTIDGVVSNANMVFVADTTYRMFHALQITSYFDWAAEEYKRGQFFMARALLIEIRKTTANGAGALRLRAFYGQY